MRHFKILSSSCAHNDDWINFSYLIVIDKLVYYLLYSVGEPREYAGMAGTQGGFKIQKLDTVESKPCYCSLTQYIILLGYYKAQNISKLFLKH